MVYNLILIPNLDFYGWYLIFLYYQDGLWIVEMVVQVEEGLWYDIKYSMQSHVEVTNDMQNVRW